MGISEGQDEGEGGQRSYSGHLLQDFGFWIPLFDHPLDMAVEATQRLRESSDGGEHRAETAYHLAGQKRERLAVKNGRSACRQALAGRRFHYSPRID